MTMAAIAEHGLETAALVSAHGLTDTSAPPRRTMAGPACPGTCAGVCRKPRADLR